MNSDCFFEIGSSHKICEDYAVSGVTSNGVCYGVLSDGCSSSRDTDIGSRLLVKSAEQTINNAECERSCRKVLMSAIHSSAAASKMLGLSYNSLDATLGFIAGYGDSVCCIIQGDGVIAYKSKYNGVIGIKVIEYDGNAPGYLSYVLDTQREKAHKNQSKGYTVHDYMIDNHGNVNHQCLLSYTEDNYDGHYYSFGDVEWVALFTDGIASFKKNDGLYMLEHELVNFFTSFKNTKGEFVKRRCNRAMKEINDLDGNNSIEHYDDFSMVCIHA